jgi:hypothetical protein
MRKLWLFSLTVCCSSPALAQRPVIVAFDEGHFNVRTLNSEYKALGDVASELGFVVRPQVGQFSASSLEGIHVLVACCARATDTLSDAERARPAHTNEELDALEQWVSEGGALLLTVDHDPIGGANEALAARFGVNALNGRTTDEVITEEAVASAIVFDRSRNGIGDHPITCGDGSRERIDRVGTWGGSSLSGPPGSVPLLLFSDSSVDALVNYVQDATVRSAAGRNQGLALVHGRGRVVILGETSVLHDYTHPTLQNREFAANVLGWLARELISNGGGCENS